MDSPPPPVTKVDSPIQNPSFDPLTWVLINVVSPILDKTGTKWKFTVGMLLLNGAWIAKAFLVPKYPEKAAMISNIAMWCEIIAGAGCGAGVVHRSLNIDPAKLT